MKQMTLTHNLQNPNPEIEQTIDYFSGNISAAIANITKYGEGIIANITLYRTRIKEILQENQNADLQKTNELILQGQNKMLNFSQLIFNISDVDKTLSELANSLTLPSHGLWKTLPRMGDEVRDTLYNVTRYERDLEYIDEVSKVTKNFSD
jgi:hypothetical protein